MLRKLVQGITDNRMEMTIFFVTTSSDIVYNNSDSEH